MCRVANGYIGRNVSTQFTSGLESWTVVNEQGILICIVSYATKHKMKVACQTKPCCGFHMNLCLECISFLSSMIFHGTIIYCSLTGLPQPEGEGGGGTGQTL